MSVPIAEVFQVQRKVNSLITTYRFSPLAVAERPLGHYPGSFSVHYKGDTDRADDAARTFNKWLGARSEFERVSTAAQMLSIGDRKEYEQSEVQSNMSALGCDWLSNPESEECRRLCRLVLAKDNPFFGGMVFQVLVEMLPADQAEAYEMFRDSGVYPPMAMDLAVLL